MKNTRFFLFATALGLLVAAHAGAQTTEPQHGQDSSNAAMKSGAADAQKQKTQGTLPMVGPASGAYKQRTDGSPAMVGPASGAYKQN